jgi:hypothetical protein
MKNFVLFFLAQATSYALVTLGFRGVAAGPHQLPLILGTDAINASLGFFVIRRISTSASGESIVGWLGYLLGSLVGTTIGMMVRI